MISPWVIYLIETIGAARVASIILAILSLLAYGIELLIRASLWGSRVQKWLLIGFGISLLLAIFLPNKGTMYVMLGVSLLTPENIEAVRSFSVDTIEQIAEAVASGIEKVTNK